MPLDDAVTALTPTDPAPVQQPGPPEPEPAPKAPEATMEAPELVPGRHVVRLWNADTGKAVEVKRSIDTGNTLDIWI